ncbi:flavodoxin domain-containing protein [Tabrizicola sp. YIM 78059]|uniref:flavodoxin domain-containing protein n=1 Tax=Tabrizicola sp. YIM 78059 TaxID=2529861 RepID=UPI0010AA03AE|nr:flavodoxin domain-containing protein [Tabrizicola sp. YIM 78059]
MPRLTRRRAMAAMVGLGLLAAGVGGAVWRPSPKLIRSDCKGDQAMTDKVLVAYATRTGSTAEVAEAIAKRFCAAGLAAEVRQVDQVAGLEGYSAVVLGSAVRFATWLPEMTGFLSAQRAALAKVPVAFFTMHMLALGEDAAALAERARYTASARAIVTPADEVFLAGKIDPARLSLIDRLLVRMVKAPLGDRRDWQKIDAWADSLVRRLAIG